MRTDTERLAWLKARGYFAFTDLPEAESMERFVDQLRRARRIAFPATFAWLAADETRLLDHVLAAGYGPAYWRDALPGERASRTGLALAGQTDRARVDECMGGAT